MGKLRVGVLRGGPSSEYEVSLASGKNVLQNLDSNKYDIKDILIDKQGRWHMRGMERPESDILNQIDVAFIALHGEYGEDGKVQRLLDTFAVPYTGSGAMASALAMNKEHTKKRVSELGITVPKGRLIEVSPDLRERVLDIMRTFSFPLIVKPNGSGSSLGVTKAYNQDELMEGIRKAFELGRQVLVEECIEGREATCSVFEDFRGEDIYSTPAIEVVLSPEDTMFDYDAKYSGRTQEICPGNFSPTEMKEIERISRDVHRHLNLDHYSRSDFIVTPEKLYFLEVNTITGLTTESFVNKSLDAIGSSFPELLDHLIGLATR